MDAIKYNSYKICRSYIDNEQRLIDVWLVQDLNNSCTWKSPLKKKKAIDAAFE